MPAPRSSVNSGPPQDTVSPRAACAKDARKAEVREFGLAGVLWGELEGACGEGMPVVSPGQSMAASIWQWFAGRRECQEVCVSGCEPGGDSLLSDGGCTPRRGSYQAPSIWIDCAGAASPWLTLAAGCISLASITLPTLAGSWSPLGGAS